MPTEVAADRQSWTTSPDGRYHYDDSWKLVTTAPDLSPGSPDPSLFALGNGFVGLRGSVLGEVGTSSSTAIVNGFYESWTIQYPELAYGFATAGQTLLTAPSPSEVIIEIDDVRFVPGVSAVRDYSRVLNMELGESVETQTWAHPNGGLFRLRLEKFVSMEEASLAACRVSVEALDTEADMTVSFLTADGTQPIVGGDPNDPRRSRDLPPDTVSQLVSKADGVGWATCLQTTRSKMKLAHFSRYEAAVPVIISDDKGTVNATTGGRIQPAAPFVVARCTTYVLGSPDAETADLIAAVAAANQLTYDAANGLHRGALASLWRAADIEIGSTTAEQQAVRFAVYQLLQSGALTSAGISAKGVSSNGYEGHYFWDTEMFLVPFWHHVKPERARELLSFRHSQLTIARSWAAYLHHDGALFAWRTINGHEASAYFLAGTAQFHINADVAYATSRFITDYPDDEFFIDGVEILVETARFFAGFGFLAGDGEFHLHCVTGPDEYTALVDDNYYTNRMAQANLRSAVAAVATLSDEQRTELVRRTALEPTESDTWRELADRMYLGYSEEFEITPQDNSFLSKERWDFSNGGPSRPLLLDEHPTTIYRHQVLKQSDVVLADFIFETEEDDELIRRNFDYYEELTTGDSSLSAGIQAAVAARLGYDKLAARHFQHALWTDLDNLHANTSDGIHVATAGSIWQCIVRGFGGVRSEDSLTIRPALPAEWECLAFPYLWRGQPLTIRITQSDVVVVNSGSQDVVAQIDGASLTVHPGERVEVERR